MLIAVRPILKSLISGWARNKQHGLCMKVIERISEWAGKGVAWLVPVLILELVYDTVARYLFNAPTEWSYDISYMLYGAIFMLGCAYTLQIDKHVRIETIYGKLSRRSKALIDAICYLIFFFPVMGSMIYFGGIFALKSWKLLEAGGDSMWQPAIYPFKTVLPLAASLLMLQGIVEFIRCVSLVVREHDADRKS
jgi:TRAP-type mannitol/chloroaromatic compound transport system permease small subunit